MTGDLASLQIRKISGLAVSGVSRTLADVQNLRGIHISQEHKLFTYTVHTLGNRYTVTHLQYTYVELKTSICGVQTKHIAMKRIGLKPIAT
jgi:hypothetical protein